MRKPVVICVDDEPTVLDSLKIELKKALGEQCLIETAEAGDDAITLLQELQEDEYDIALVLSDHIMPDIKGDELLKKIHQMSPKTLKIMLTGQADLESVGNAIKYARLYRYIAKPWQPEDLKLTVVEAVHSYLQDKKLAEQNLKLQQLNQELERLTRQQADIIDERTAQLKKANQELQRLAVLDSLTQIANRRRFDEYLAREWRRGIREYIPLSLILCDVDFFKRYNDAYGHQGGDNCLFRLAQAMIRSVKRPADLVARYGGEEFGIILPNTDAMEAMGVAEAVQTEIHQLKIPHAQSYIGEYVTVSLGVATLIPSLNASSVILIKGADDGLYEAKRQGRNRAIFQPLALDAPEVLPSSS